MNDTQQQSQAGLCPSDAALKDMCRKQHGTQSAQGWQHSASISRQPGGHPCAQIRPSPRLAGILCLSFSSLAIEWLLTERDHPPDSFGFLCRSPWKLPWKKSFFASWLCLFSQSCLTL